MKCKLKVCLIFNRINNKSPFIYLKICINRFLYYCSNLFSADFPELQVAFNTASESFIDWSWRQVLPTSIWAYLESNLWWVVIAVAAIAAVVTAVAAGVKKSWRSCSGLELSLIQNLLCLRAFFVVGLLECSYCGRLTQFGSFVYFPMAVSMSMAAVLSMLDYFDQSSLHLLEIKI